MSNFTEKKDDTSKSHQGLGNKPKDSAKKIMLIIILAAVILIAAIWIWKNSQISNVREEAAREKQMIQNRAKTLIINSHKEHLKLLAKPYVWAVRSELMQGNINQVNLYANEMVKEKNFLSIIVANNKGIIISSTNKKNEGKEFTSAGKPEYLSADTTVVEKINDSLLIMSSPIMGFNNKLGTLMINYKIQQPGF